MAKTTNAIVSNDERVVYDIQSWGNGYFVEITRVSDGVAVFLQGDDATRFMDELQRTSERWSDGHAAAALFD